MRVPKKAKGKPVVIDTPEFKSEAEEAAWWDRHQGLIADLLLKDGRRNRRSPEPAPGHPPADR
jgi:hypothetical protein